MNMGDNGPLFILAGNGPYGNRGCEAIVRGTTEILRHHFDKPRFVCISHFKTKEQFEEQVKKEYDESIRHLSCYYLSKRDAILNCYRPKVWKYISGRHHAVRSHSFDEGRLGNVVYEDMLPFLSEASAVLSVGGDNYSLDYGKPYKYTTLDDLVLNRDKPLIIWGASVGPFGKDPIYEEQMSRHLRKVTGIFARESLTIDYLKSVGVTGNVHPAADPAFLMDAVKPKGIDDELPIDEEAIGINLSPLMARYVTDGDLDAWANRAASIIGDVARRTEMPVYLIPHVINPTSNDHTFMQQVLSRVGSGRRDIVLVPPKYDAAETKWIISRMTLFAGARTHSTIAALSSGVPTLSFAYSIKAQGINRDMFGHTGYCMGPDVLDGKHVSERIMSMLDESAAIGGELIKQVRGVRELALSAGAGVKDILWKS